MGTEVISPPAFRVRSGTLAIAFCLICQAAFAGPEIQHWRTANGARVLFVESHELPMVDVDVVFDAGSARDGTRPGLAALANSLLYEGAAGLSADQIAQQFENLGAQYAAESQRDMANLTLRALSDAKTLQQAVDLLAKVIAHPDFPAASLERQRNNMLLGLQMELEQPASIAERAFYKALYGDHPYALPPSGTETALKAIGRDQLVDFKRSYYVGANAIVGIVGDLSRGAAEQLATQVIGGLPRGEPAPALPEVSMPSAVPAVEIAHPSQQTHILLGQPGVSRLDPDYFPLYVGNHILGGSGLVARISQQVREARGLAYSAYSYFVPMRRPGPWIAGMQTRNDQAGAARTLLLEVIDQFIAQGPTADELHRAKQNITGGFPLRFNSNKKILGYIAMIGFYDLPDDYLETFTQRVEAVTAEQIRDSFQRRLKPDSLVGVTVGGG